MQQKSQMLHHWLDQRGFYLSTGLELQHEIIRKQRLDGKMENKEKSFTAFESLVWRSFSGAADELMTFVCFDFA